MKRAILATVLLVALGLTGPLAAATLTVPTDYATIQAAIDAASPGDTVLVLDGTYTPAGTVTITKALTLLGQSEAGTVIDESGLGGYGFLVTASDVTLEQFTILAPTPNYPIHASGTGNPPDGYDNLAIRHVTVQGTHQRSCFDIHGYNHVVLSYLTAADATGGNGVQVTGCVDVQMDHITTHDNAWGSIAVYCSGPGYLNRPSSDVTIDGATLSVAEGVVFTQDEFGLANTGVTVAGWDYLVRNTDFRPDAAGFTYFQDSEGSAVAMALGFTGYENASTIEVISSGHWVVADGMSIQAAIDAAQAGDTIEIRAGHFPGQLHLAKADLTLVGAGVGSTFVEGTASMSLYFTTSADNHPVIFVDGVDGTAVRNLSVDGKGLGNSNYRYQGIGFYNAGGTLEDLTIAGVRDEPLSGAQHGNGIYAIVDDASSHTVTATNVDISDCQKTGAVFHGAGLAVVLTDVHSTGNGPLGSGLPAQNGIQVSGGAVATMTDCSVAEYTYTGGGWTATGFLLYAAGSATMDGCTADGSQTSYYIQDSDCGMTGCTLANPTGDAMYAYVTTAKGLVTDRPQAAPFDATPVAAKATMAVQIDGCTFTGAGATDSWGPTAWGGGGNLSFRIDNSTVTGWDWGVVIYDSDTSTIQAEGHGNTIAGNTSYGVYNNTGTGVDFTANWWGDASGPHHPLENPFGAGDEVGDDVDFDPWVGMGNVAALPSTSGPINCADTQTLTFRYTPDAHTPGLRGYSVTVACSAELTFGAGDIAFLGGLGAGTVQQVTDNGDGTFTVDEAILGPTSGLQAAADLFTVTFHPVGDGNGQVTIPAITLRDPDNVEIAATVAGATITVDCTAPPAVTGITADPGHQKVAVSWSMADESDVDHYEVYRGLWYDTNPGTSAYPEYDDLPGSTIPTRPADRNAAAASAEWELAGTVAAGTLTFTDSGMTTGRGVYYYEVFPVDAAVNYGPPAAANDRATNYWLGDVDPTPPDGDVDSGDITVMGATYGLAEGDAGYDNEVDVGPTDDHSGFGIPSTDSVIDFEDLMIFAMNYSVVSPTKAEPVTGAAPALAWVRMDPVTWSLQLTGGAGLQGVRLVAPLPAGVTATVTGGDLLSSQDGPVFLRNIDRRGLDAGLALLGRGLSFGGTGELLRVVTSEPVDLAPQITARGSDNAELEFTLGSEGLVPRAFVAEQNHPNPFNPSTAIEFRLPERRHVRLGIYTLDGKLVRRLVDGDLPAGEHAVTWDGRDDGGRAVASGTYLYRVVAGRDVVTRKMTLAR